MRTRPARLHIEAVDNELQWWRGHCGACGSCRAGYEAWCEAVSGPEALPSPASGWRPVADTLLARLTPAGSAAAAVVLDVLDHVRLEPGSCVLVVGPPGPLGDTDALSSRAGATVVVEPELRPASLSGATREALGVHASGSGRPDVVVTFGGALAGCSRWVRRGGVIASCPWWVDEPDRVALDTLVMREVTLAPIRRPHMQLEGGRRS